MGVDLAITIGCAVGGLVLWLWKNSAIKQSIEATTKKAEKLETKVESVEKRTDKLEWQSENTDRRLDEIKQAVHKTNNTVQSVAGDMLLVKDWVQEQKRHNHEAE